ncbi:MAG: TIGR02391 family protein [Candidatus Aminicenantes bacterium]|nr:TIGR02391 family protein [Candidatus Aminicenantes bacterium]MBL7083779.1 TIGR02391 family protein [Candidatus Aminicenantes bacterium]
MVKIRKFELEVLQKLCDILGDTHTGLTGSEIGKLLHNCRIDDPLPGYTKRHRLFEALSQRQESDGCANNIIAFIQAAMNPVRYVDNREGFDLRRNRLNKALAFAGFFLEEDGKLHYAEAVHTLSEAEQRAGRLRKQLSERNIHPDVLRFCRAELLQDNYFHAVFEATKSVADKIRQKSGLKSDGSKLMDDAFAISLGGYPHLAFNSLQTETELSEHKGLMNLIKGLFGTFRNVTAHAPKIKWSINEQDALDMLTLTSLLHRRLDGAVRTSIP